MTAAAIHVCSETVVPSATSPAPTTSTPAYARARAWSAPPKSQNTSAANDANAANNATMSSSKPSTKIAYSPVDTIAARDALRRLIRPGSLIIPT